MRAATPMAAVEPATVGARCWHHRLRNAIEPEPRAILSESSNDIVQAGGTGQVHLPPGAEHADSACSAVIDTLGSSAPLGDCHWNFPENSSDEDGDSLKLARAAGGCLVIEGNRLLASGDADAAIERYVQTLRLAASLRNGGGDSLMYLSGLAIAGPAVDRLATLVGSADGGRVASRIRDRLPHLAPRNEGLTDAVEAERLRGLKLLPAYETPERLAANEWAAMAWESFAILVPRKAIGVYFLTTVREPAFQAIARAIAIEDSKESVAQMGEVLNREEGVARALIDLEASHWPLLRISHDDLVARFRLLATAGKLEQLRAVSGAYPSDESPLDLPIDPFAWPRTIRYQTLSQGRGYRVWSVGSDRVDDRGTASGRKDLVLEQASHLPRQSER